MAQPAIRQNRISKALATAQARAKRSNQVIRELLSTATVRLQLQPHERIVVTFTAYPFRGGLHQIYKPAYIDDATDRELAKTLSWSLRESVHSAA
jgi:hypothetical protein